MLSVFLSLFTISTGSFKIRFIMLDRSLGDTIIAVSTPPGYGGVGILRLSGKKSLRISKKIFRPANPGIKIMPRLATFGNLIDPESGEPLDEGYLIFFPGPHSYTRENIVEISLHGSPAVLEEGLRQGVKAGARPARPGEFTLRAFLQGRIDMIQAAAVNDLIRSSSLRAAKAAFSQVAGKLSRRISLLRKQAVELLADLESSIEFPDDKIGVSPQKISLSFERMALNLNSLISSYDAGQALLNGVTLAIAGRTNVGKSTLFNAILEDERAIVTPFPGTTRDFLRERIKIDDQDFILVDMAGLGKASSPVEEEGIKRGNRLAAAADGLLLLLDAARKEDTEDFRLIEKFKDKKVLVLFNKIDLPRKMDLAKMRRRYPGLASIEISALKGTNLNRLKEKIHEIFAPAVNEREDIIFHIWQKLSLEEALRHVRKTQKLLDAGHSEEIGAEEIRKIMPVIGGLTGEIKPDDVIEDIFNRFCVGK
jgi:tRNA modification GTPase